MSGCARALLPESTSVVSSAARAPTVLRRLTGNLLDLAP
jgi:hypothetical protein